MTTALPNESVDIIDSWATEECDTKHSDKRSGAINWDNNIQIVLQLKKMKATAQDRNGWSSTGNDKP